MQLRWPRRYGDSNVGWHEDALPLRGNGILLGEPQAFKASCSHFSSICLSSVSNMYPWNGRKMYQSNQETFRSSISAIQTLMID